MGSLFKAVFPWIIIGISIIVIVVNNNKKENNYLVQGMIYGTILGSIIGLTLKYIIKLKADVGLYITICSLLGEVLGTLIKKEYKNEKK